MTATLLTILASVAAISGCTGLYGVTSYSVAQRTREIGTRMALGADRTNIILLVLGQGFILVVIGLIAGVFISLLSSRALSNLLYGIEATDATTLGPIVLLMTGIALISLYIPAYRASTVQPAFTLRAE